MGILDAVLFDLDGVLVRSEEVWFRTVEEAGRVFRRRPVTREEFAPTFGQGTRADVEQFQLGCAPDELNRFYLEVFPRFASETSVNPEARRVLERLRALGLKRAVVTNTVSPLAFIVLRSAGLFDLLDWVACADHVLHAKPAPDLVLHAAQKLGVEPPRAWMVGDSRFDREAAGAAGVCFVGLGIDGELRIDRLDELIPLLEAVEASAPTSRLGTH